MTTKHAELLSAGLCFLVAASLTLAFMASSLLLGGYTAIDIYIGSIWFFLISLIVSLSTLLPHIKERVAKK